MHEVRRKIDKKVFEVIYFTNSNITEVLDWENGLLMPATVDPSPNNIYGLALKIVGYSTRVEIPPNRIIVRDGSKLQDYSIEEFYKLYEEIPKPIRFTVKELREKLKDAPDDAIVYYQRIEDKYFGQHGWDTKRLVWEKYKNYTDYSEYIAAFSAYLHPDENIFVINAHY